MTSPSNPVARKGPRWSREQIRAARLAPLGPLLQQRGLQLVAREDASASGIPKKTRNTHLAMQAWKTCQNQMPRPRSMRRSVPNPGENLNTAGPIISLQPERAYSATNCDAGSANCPKTLRFQLGRKYDATKIRSKYWERR